MPKSSITRLFRTADEYILFQLYNFTAPSLQLHSRREFICHYISATATADEGRSTIHWYSVRRQICFLKTEKMLGFRRWWGHYYILFLLALHFAVVNGQNLSQQMRSLLQHLSNRLTMRASWRHLSFHSITAIGYNILDILISRHFSFCHRPT